jgi:RHS repeat-associated protein
MQNARQPYLTDSDIMELHYGPQDHLGSTRAVIQREGASVKVVESMMYQAYGKMIPLAVQTDPVRMTFTTKEFDNESGMGLYYFGKRYYDAEVGRWISPDPNRQFHDLYRYTTNPIAFVDLQGLDDFYYTIVSGAGSLAYRDDKGKVLWTVPANSGAGKGFNKPEMQNVPNSGPIPEGKYAIDLQNGGAPDPDRQGGGWGAAAWRLKESFGTLLARKFGSLRGGGFFLHEDPADELGNRNGTIGCVGVASSEGIQKVQTAIQEYAKDNKSINMTVDYENKSK